MRDKDRLKLRPKGDYSAIAIGWLDAAITGNFARKDQFHPCLLAKPRLTIEQHLLFSTDLPVAMKSLRRDLSSNPQAANVTSKVFVRSTKSGKVQKIVRELYLRQDIPCSSKLCSICPSIAPADANGNSELGCTSLSKTHS